MNQLASTLIRRTVAVPRRRPALPLLTFLLLGTMETLLSYLVFSRADDHAYFLELANYGLSAVPEMSPDLLMWKAETAGRVFHFIASPSRWLGGHELLHLLWLRLLTLLGFLAAFNWVQRFVVPNSTFLERQRAMKAFLVLTLIYPGQLAWTSSLLRDGLATTLFFYGLYCLRKDWHLLLSVPFFVSSFALRPEYVLILLCIGFAIRYHSVLARVSWRVSWVVAGLLLFSVATHPFQVQSAVFSQLAFSEGGMSYPLIANAFDLPGYVLVLAQAVVDPIGLISPQINAFGLAESLFFIYLLWHSRKLLRHRNTRMGALTVSVIFGMWIFAYFEIYVSGFSRHRLGLEVALIALLATHFATVPAKRRPAHAPFPPDEI